MLLRVQIMASTVTPFRLGCLLVLVLNTGSFCGLLNCLLHPYPLCLPVRFSGEWPSNHYSCGVHYCLLSLDCRCNVTSSYLMLLPWDCSTMKDCTFKLSDLKKTTVEEPRVPLAVKPLHQWSARDEITSTHVPDGAVASPAAGNKKRKHSPGTGKTLTESSLVFSL